MLNNLFGKRSIDYEANKRIGEYYYKSPYLVEITAKGVVSAVFLSLFYSVAVLIILLCTLGNPNFPERAVLSIPQSVAVSVLCFISSSIRESTIKTGKIFSWLIQVSEFSTCLLLVKYILWW